ncbi:MAG: haloacid dehalogenase-like hydrolase [Bradymonadales bacterium]|nr:haloacid dehalogenase-like hydrolase [Bradymonadales bacterium]
MENYNLPPRQPHLLPDFVKALPQDGTGALAIFDADGTLWRNDVADDSTLWFIENGHTSKDASWEEYIRIYRQDHAAGCQYLLRFYAGLTVQEMHRHIWNWWKNHSHRTWIVEVLEALYWLAERNYTIWVVTGSPTDTMLPLRDFLPVHEIVGMDFEVDAKGVITGNYTGISCADEGKAEKVRFLWGDRPIPFAAGNGPLDRWMLELADPVIWSVYPNDAFRQVSLHKGWYILERPADFIEEIKLA